MTFHPPPSSSPSHAAKGGLDALQDLLQLERAVLDRNRLEGTLDPLAPLRLLRELTLEYNQIAGERPPALLFMLYKLDLLSLLRVRRGDRRGSRHGGP